MIIKANRHSNGAKLAAYLMNGGKHGERVEPPELRGFGPYSDDIFKAFGSLHVMADASEIENPLFHVQIRLPEGEQISREQWQRTADRTQTRLGLDGQARADVYHIDEKTGELHLHLAFSLIDPETLKARQLPFFKFRLKALARELENEFDITRVTNVREGPIKYAAKKNEQQQAQRLDVNKDELRNTIRACWDHSDNGRSFEAALAHEGMILAQGDRRSLVVVDHAGGVHSLGKRILDVNKAGILERLSDLDLNELPSVQQVQEFVRDNSREQRQPDKLDRLKSELAEVQQLQAEAAAGQREKPAPVWDRDRANADWERAVMNAAIEKEKRERQSVEPSERETRAGREQARAEGRKEKHWPINPPQPERKSAALFNEAATGAARDERTQHLHGPALHAWNAWRQTGSDQATAAAVTAALDKEGVSLPTPTRKVFAAALDDKGIRFARAAKEEADRSHREAEFAKAVGKYAPRYKEGEIVIVTEPSLEFRKEGEINEPRRRVHKLDQSLAEKFVKALGIDGKLQGIDATIKASDQRAHQRAADWQAIRFERAANIRGGGRTRAGNARDNLLRAPAAVLKPVTMGFNLIGKPLEILGNLFEPPILTPEQKRAGEIAAHERQADVRDKLEHTNAISERAAERRQEEEGEAARQREERERYGGGRER